MPEDEGAPRTDVVHVPVSIDVGEPRARAFTKENRRPADAAEGTHRRIDSAGNVSAGFLEQAHRGSSLAAAEGAMIIANAGRYGILAVVEFGLLWKYIKAGAAPFSEPPNPGVDKSDDDAPMAFAY